MSTSDFYEYESFDLSFSQRHPTFMVVAITALSVIALVSSVAGGYFFARNQKTTEQLNAVSLKIDNLQQEISLMRNKPDQRNNDTHDLAAKLDGLESKIDEIDSNVSSIKLDVGGIESGLNNIKSEVSSIQLKVGY